MKTRLLPTSVLLGAVLLAGTGGAVAGSLVTSAKIKDGTILVKDLAPRTRSELQSVGGYKRISKTVKVDAGEGDSLAVLCGLERDPLSVSAGWLDSDSADHTYLRSELVEHGALVTYQNYTADDDQLVIDVVCARTTS